MGSLPELSLDPVAGFSADFKGLSLKDASRGLRRFGDGAEATIIRTHPKASAIVVSAAQANIGQQPVPKTRGMIRTHTGSREGGVELRSTGFPWAAGAEFGSHRFSQFRRYVGGGSFSVRRPSGYMIGAAVVASINRIDRVYADAVEKSADDAIPR